MFIPTINPTPPRTLNRYAIHDASADWSMAEAQVASLGNGTAHGGREGKSTVVSVKSVIGGEGATKKRKMRRVMGKKRRRKAQNQRMRTSTIRFLDELYF